MDLGEKGGLLIADSVRLSFGVDYFLKKVSNLAPMKRLFVVDHVAAFPYGHNISCMNVFASSFGRHFSETIKLGPTCMPEIAGETDDIHKVLNYPYNGIIEAKYFNGFFRNKKRSIKISFLIRKVTKNFYSKWVKTFDKDLMLRQTKRNWQKVLKKYNIDSSDTLFFPSTDYYGARALLEICNELDKAERPKMHFRFIGVMENAAYGRIQGCTPILNNIKKLIEEGASITISAETPIYCSYLQKLTHLNIIYLAYPLEGQLEPLNWDIDNFKIALPGQGRRDKGYFRFYDIAKFLNRDSKARKFKMLLQGMKLSDPCFNKPYNRILAEIKSLELLPAQLGINALNDIYKKSDILLQPYCTGTYAYRGSAVYQEGIAFGRLFVCSKNTGISNLVQRYGNGLLADTDEDFAKSIIELSKLSKQEVEKKVYNARALYEADFEEGKKLILEGILNG
ncbi:MAG: hypothetical protein COZ46_02455 [Verrucomicrobia bacterium CG_4_10_14_3_um_filter_43_23]|nr:MAG: hypothetical protein AUJ82_08420 [Verrucomicrobia bacterium CG1_02_43_26]PIX58721.1 MAG: hypothetical protein COZ46_02455 [Verrucomicrobia bacterium CG_4_10_14_3_um_filter_43_23]PIY62733.1 MAG: hypothetical protein COY94_01200 [Verrucomicrobia bacterium CG_4_10_14_0_8_um_filter_43_34]PJA44437.1 MAG: hypothetical protein CO175_02640 [Verrucomicrobia bacterium CG_4_9_14_3_um_filter_43_20]